MIGTTLVIRETSFARRTLLGTVAITFAIACGQQALASGGVGGNSLGNQASGGNGGWGAQWRGWDCRELRQQFR